MSEASNRVSNSIPENKDQGTERLHIKSSIKKNIPENWIQGIK